MFLRKFDQKAISRCFLSKYGQNVVVACMVISCFGQDTEVSFSGEISWNFFFLSASFLLVDRYCTVNHQHLLQRFELSGQHRAGIHCV